MIAALITFAMDPPLTLAEATTRFESTAPNYRGLPGLVSKAYIHTDGGSVVGGFYVWESRAAAEAQYAGDWKAKVTAVYGTEPRIQYFEVPVYIQNTR